MSLPAMPGTARIVAVRFRLGFSWFSWLQLLGRPWSACGCSLSLLCGWCTVTSGGAQPVSQSWRLFPACRRGYIHRVSAGWLVHVCGARVRAARTNWASRPGSTLRWPGLWFSYVSLVVAARPSLSTRVHTPGLRGVVRPRLRSSCPRGTDHLGGSTIVRDETTWLRLLWSTFLARLGFFQATPCRQPDSLCRGGVPVRLAGSWFLDNLADRTVWCVRVRPPELIRWAARRVGSRVPVD